MSNRTRAPLVPQRSARPTPAAPGLPFWSCSGVGGRLAPLVLDYVGSQPALPPDGADGSWNAPRFVPMLKGHLAFGAARTSQWAERTARQRLGRGGRESEAD